MRTPKASVVVYVPRFRDLPGSPSFPTLTKAIPIIDAMIPSPAKTRGRVTRYGIWDEAPRIIAAMIAAMYESNRSAPEPAQSPTLSPTLSAMTAGFLGSSSGMPSSILPTRSAAMSAVLVNIPPPAFMKRVRALGPMLIPRRTSGSPVIQ